MGKGIYSEEEKIYMKQLDEKKFKEIFEEVEKIKADKKLNNIQMAKICKRLAKYYESAPRV